MDTRIISKNKALKCNILKKEYMIISNIIIRIQKVIIDNEIILNYSKNNCMKSLNDIIKKLNEIYNNSIIEIFTTDDSIVKEHNNEGIIDNYIDANVNVDVVDEVEDTFNDEVDNDTDGTCGDDMLNYINNQEQNSKYSDYDTNIINMVVDSDTVNMDIINNLKTLFIDDTIIKHVTNTHNIFKLINYDPFIIVKNNIKTLCKIVGYYSLGDIIYLECNINNFEFTDNYDSEFYKLLQEIFLPINYNILPIKNVQPLKDNSIEIKKYYDNKLITLFNSQAEVSINIGNKVLRITGYIKNDPLNIYIKTSQICNTYIYEKKNKLEKIIKKVKNIDYSFSEIYFKNMSTFDIITLSEEQFNIKLNEDYYKFIELNKIQFIKLIKTFTKDANENIYNMYNIIKLLLLGSNENCAIASLLFNMLKDKKYSSHSECISNLIYNQLNYASQLKLKNSVFNIKNELEKLKDMSSGDIDLKKQVILSKNMPNHIKKICIDKIDELKNNSNESYKIKMYVNILIQYPWLTDLDDNYFKSLSISKDISKKFLEDTKNNLDSKIYGHKEAKDKIMEMLGKIIAVQGCNIHPIGLAGPPGVGKTKFAQVLSECLNIPFVQITLGGQNDGELLHGHGYTYSGSQPGLIVKKMVEAGSGRCIMYFDELDKCVSKHGGVNELTSILIHLTDPMTNNAFQDRFFQEITFPLNKVIFIFSFNDISKIDRILIDRMEIINVESYNIKEKVNITNDYLLKDICKSVGFEYKSIIFPEPIITKIVEEYTYEPGVRSLKRAIESILLKLNLDKIYSKGNFVNGEDYTTENPLVIDTDILINYLGTSKITYKTIHTKPMIGVINGMYATTACFGGIVPIQIIGNHDGKSKKFSLRLTGNQKKIMKESIKYSFTTAINLLSTKGKKKFFSNYPNGLHIHTPEAATPKDGPSAGVAFTIAFLSVMLGLKIKNNISLTGEIDLYGNITKIGGVKYKVQGAFKANVNVAYLPKENEEDYEKLKKDMPEIFDDNHYCILAEHVLEVAKEVLIDYNTKAELLTNDVSM
jgi:endopeptidase La